jgi:hypothetical protein
MGQPSNVVGILDPTINAGQGLYETSTTQKAKLGTRIRVGERTFHYALSATANTPGYVMIAPSLVASHFSGAGTLVASASTGSSVITLTAGAAVTLNQYAEGYLCIASTALAGGGFFFRIKGNAAISSGATGTATLYDTIPSSLGGGPATLVPNQFSGVTLGSATTQYPIGVCPVTVASGDYFWMQTYGPAPVNLAGACVPTLPVVMGSAGAVTPYVALGASSAGAPIVGYSVHTGVGTQVGVVQLTLIP